MSSITLKSQLLAFFAFSVSLTSIAQSDYRPGYIIKNNQDSINGFVSYSSDKKNSDRCSFRETKKSKTVNFSASDLKAYGFFGDRQYESRNLPVDSLQQPKVFVKVLVKGPLSLYRYRNLFFLEKPSQKGLILLPVPVNKTVETKQGTMLLHDHRYVDILNTFLEDAQLSANRSGYNEDDLTRLINNYNRFKGHEPSTKNQRPVVSLNYEIFAGYVKSNMKMDIKNNEVSFSPSSTVMGGVGIDITSPKIFDKISLSIQLWYIKAFYQAYSESPYTAGDLVHEDILIDLSFLKVPIGFRYNFLGQTNTPYVKFGFAPSFILSSSLRTINEIEIGNVVKVEKDYRNYNVKNSQGIWLGVGYDKTIVGNVKMFVELRGEKTNGFIGSSIQSSSSSINYNILVGFRF